MVEPLICKKKNKKKSFQTKEEELKIIKKSLFSLPMKEQLTKLAFFIYCKKRRGKTVRTKQNVLFLNWKQMQLITSNKMLRQPTDHK